MIKKVEKKYFVIILLVFMVLNAFLCVSAVEIVQNSTNSTDAVVGNYIKNDTSINVTKNSTKILYVSVDGADNNTGVSEFESKRTIQKAIDKAPKKSETTIIIKPGVYYENIQILKHKNIILKGENATINGNATNVCIYVYDGAKVRLSGFTITNGATKCSGAGILNKGILTIENTKITRNHCNVGGIYNGKNLNIINSTISDNTASNAGGILNNGILKVKNTTIQANNASNYGGGIFSFSGELCIYNSTITGNNATNGGGIYLFIGKLCIYNSTITGNNATNGGGISTFTENLKVYNSKIRGNTATSNGGGLCSYKGQLCGCVFEGNSASKGGAIYSKNLGKTINCEFRNNTAANGGSIFINGGKAKLNSCVFNHNSAQNYGGAIDFNSKKFLEIINCEFEDNTANNGGAIALKGTLKDYYTSIFTNNKPTNIYKIT